MKRAGSSDLAVMQGSGHYQNKMADIIVDRQRADVRHYPVVFIRCKKEQNTFSLRSFSVLFKFPSEHPREQISVLNIFSTSVTCNFLDSIRKWHLNPDDSTEIKFRLILSVLQFNIKLCNSSSAIAFIFCCPVSRPGGLFSLLNFGFVGAH